MVLEIIPEKKFDENGELIEEIEEKQKSKKMKIRRKFGQTQAFLSEDRDAKDQRDKKAKEDYADPILNIKRTWIQPN